MANKKKNKKKMPSAPIKALVGNVKGVGKMGQTTGGISYLTNKPSDKKTDNQRIITGLLRNN